MVSILSDSLIFCSGGLLPLMASATSSNFANDVLEACGGMTLDAGFSFMNRVLNVVDVVAFSSTINFTSVETHRNMSPGGVLRQCIRLGNYFFPRVCGLFTTYKHSCIVLGWTSLIVCLDISSINGSLKNSYVTPLNHLVYYSSEMGFFCTSNSHIHILAILNFLFCFCSLRAIYLAGVLRPQSEITRPYEIQIFLFSFLWSCKESSCL